MSVYVDTARNDFGRMKMCHMLADTRDELLAMADRIGVAHRWYQDFNKASCPHFDIAQSKRTLAVAAGAIEVNRQELAAIIRRIKSAALALKRAGKPHGWESPEKEERR